MFSQETEADESGAFEFKNLQFVDSVTAIFQASKKRNKEKKNDKADPLQVRIDQFENLDVHDWDQTLFNKKESYDYSEYLENDPPCDHLGG